MGKNRAGLGPGEDDGNCRWPLDSVDLVDEVELSLQNLLVKEEKSTQGLVLGRGGDVFVDREMSEKPSDFLFAHLAGMAFVMEKDEAADPVDIHLSARME